MWCLRERAGGHIVNVSSELGLLRGLPENAKRAITSANTLEDLQRVSYSDADASKVPQPTSSMS